MLSRLFLLSLVLFTCGFFSSIEAATFVVDRADDALVSACTNAANDCTLRGAITAANANGAGADIINFAITGSGVKTITLVSPLPAIKSSLTVRGQTQAGYFGKPLIEINGGGVPNSNGLEIDTPAPFADISVTIIALALNRHLYGIYSDCFRRCDITLLGNFIGTNADGTAALPNNGEGISISPNGDINIGGEGLFEGNLISGNGNVGNGNPNAGIGISPHLFDSTFAGSFDITIKGNKIGTNFDGNAALGNADNGIFISELNGGGGAVVNLNVIIGGANAAARNVISGNVENGIDLRVSSATIVGNFIGTNANGNAALGNGVLDSFITDYGIYIAAQNGGDYQIGGDAAGAGNVISGNNGFGVHVATGAGGNGTAQLTVQGNFIGTNAAGTAALGNEMTGISIDSSTNYTVNAIIGGVTAAARNIVSGNKADGISLGSGNVSIYGNYIGTDKNGANDLGNTLSGVRVIYDGNVKIGGTLVLSGTSYDAGNLISGNNGNGITVPDFADLPVTIRRNKIGTNLGGTSAIPNSKNGISIGNSGAIIGSDINPLDGNVISGNGEDGIFLDGATGSADFAKIYGNRIGTNSIGGDFLPNAQNGIEINGSPNNQIGLAGNGTAINIIAGNNERGIYLSGANSTGNKIENNIIGAGATGNDLGNAGSGIEIFAASQNFIGGASGAGNTIAFNQKGVWVRSGNNNAIRRNSVYSNDQLGIDLGAAGVTPNDAGDADTGANNLQNFPVLAVVNPNNIAGSLNSAPNTSYEIDFYRTDSCDVSGSGEGRYLLASKTVTTDALGNAPFNQLILSSVGEFVAATATVSGAGAKDTSEFSQCTPITAISNVALSAANYTVSEASAQRTIVVNRTGGTAGTVTVDYATSNGTATAGQDYTATSGTLTFLNGEVTKNFNIPITNDTTDEADETVNITLSNPTGGATLTVPGTAVLTILDNDAAPTISVSDVSQIEGDSGTSSFIFHVQLSAASGKIVSVNGATLDGTANAPADYLVNNGTIDFAAGETTKNVFVTVNGDTAPEANESFYLQLTNSTNATIADNQGFGLILDDDTAALVSIGGTIRQSDNTPFGGATVRLTGTQTAQTTTDANGRFTFPNVQSGGNFTVTPAVVNYSFAPANRQFNNVTGNVSNADFTATYAPPREVTVISGITTQGQNGSITTEIVAQGNEHKIAFSLSYDPTILSNPQVSPLPDSQTAILLTDNSVAGKVGVSLTLPVGQTYPAGTRTLVVVTFNTMPTNAPGTPVNFDDAPTVREITDANSGELNANYVGGSIFFAQGYEADVASRFAGNGALNDDDFAQAGRFIAGLDQTNPNYNEFQRADSAPRIAAGNGSLTVADFVQAGRYAAGIDAPQQASGQNAPNLFEFNEDGKLTDESLILFKKSSGIKKPSQDETQNLVPTIVRVVNASASPNSQVLVSIETDANGAENGFGFTLNYDANKLSSPLVSLGTATQNATLISNTLQAGKVGVVLGMSAGQGLTAGTKQLVTIRFNVALNATAGQTALTFDDSKVFREIADADANVLQSTFQDGAITVFGATAATVAVGGRVTTADGRGIGNARLNLLNGGGTTRTVISNPSGYYRFADVPAGETYVLTVSSKRFHFANPSRVLTISEEMNDINFALGK